MYREMLSEFENLANTCSQEEIEVIATQVLAGLEKMAKMETEELEKEALDPIGAAGAAGAAALGLGLAAFKRKKPQLLTEWHLMKAVSSENKKHIYEELANKHTEEFNKNLAAMRKQYGLGSVPANTGGSSGSAASHNKPNYKAMKDPEKRVTTEIEGTKRKTQDIASDINALKTKDWLDKNKYKMLAGGGAAAIIGKQQMDKEKQEAELRGAYGVAGRGRW